jgi:hypothetical protein
MRGVVVRPVNHATALVPDVLASHHHGIPWLDGDAPGEIEIVRYENREAIRHADQEPLMS